MTKQGGIVSFIKGLYYDEFKWALVKSIGIFALGIRIAQECQGIELVPSQS